LRQLLTDWHGNGEKMLAFTFSSQVGCGSEEHCLLGNECTSASTWKSWSVQPVGQNVKDVVSVDSDSFVIKVSMNGLAVASMSGG